MHASDSMAQAVQLADAGYTQLGRLLREALSEQSDRARLLSLTAMCLLLEEMLNREQ